MPRIVTKPAATAGMAIFFLVLPLFAGCALNAGMERPRPEIGWLSLQDGLLAAAGQGKPCLVDFFYGPRCPRCRLFMDRIYSDPDIAARIERDFVPIRIDLTSPLSTLEMKLAEEMENGGECMLLFLDRRGMVIKREDASPVCSMDAMSRQEFAAILDEVTAITAATAGR